MASWAVIFLIVAASFLLGRLLLLPFFRSRRRFDGDWLARFFASVTLGVIIIGWLALVLAELGWFSIGRLAGLWLLVVAASSLLAIWSKRKYSQLDVGESGGRTFRQDPLFRFLPAQTEYVFLGLWLVAAMWLFFRPHEFVLGAADAGVYVNFGANISKSGGIVFVEPALSDLAAELQPAVLRPLPESERASLVAPYYLFPGFFVTGQSSGQITPQFYPLHAVWQAVAHSLGGIRTELMFTGLWAVLGSLAIYLTARQIAGWEAAALALMGLSINALQVWFARYPTTEALTQYLLWAGLWSTMLWLDRREPEPFWGLLAGLAMGAVFLVRIDAYFLLAIPGAIWLWLQLTGRWRKESWWFFLPLGLLIAHSLIHALWQSRPYFYNIFGYGINLLSENLALPLVAIVVAIIALIVLSRHRRELGKLNRFRRPVLLLIMVAVASLVIFGWFVRPQLSSSIASYVDWYGGGQVPLSLDKENLVRLGWYLSPLGIVLATAGACLMIWKINRQTAVLLAVGLGFSLVYLWRIQANPHQVYAMRRYVPVTLPFAVIAAAYLLDWLMRRKRKWLRASGLLLAGLWLVGFGLSARGFVSQVDHRDLVRQIEELNQKVDPNSIFLFNDQAAITLGDILGTPMHYLFDHEVYSLRNIDALNRAVLRETIADWQRDGQTIYWVGERSLMDELELGFSEAFTVSIRSQRLEGTYDRKPTNIVTTEWTLDMARIE